jgi:hypothetical protein
MHTRLIHPVFHHSNVPHPDLRGPRRIARAAAVIAAAVSCLAPIGAHAAGSADLTVTGVIRPAACSTALSGGAIADFGTISARALSATAATVLPAQIVTLTITCNTATKVGITTTDNRAGTVNEAAGTALISTPGYTFGVGAIGGKTIGAYSLMLGSNAGVQATADGASVTAVYSQDGGKQWISSLLGPAQPGVRLHAWAPSSSSPPAAYKVITQPIKVTLALGKTGDLPPLDQEVQIDGLATISLSYL